MSETTEVFKRSKRSRWSVRIDEPTPTSNGEAYGHHSRCPSSRHVNNRWSWFLEDEGRATCYECNAAVPDYIQCLVRLYEGRL